MTPEQIEAQEKFCTGTSWTRHNGFEANGFLIIKQICSPELLQRPVPHLRGQINYWGKKDDQFNYNPVENQVNESLSTYNYPGYKELHSQVRTKIEQQIGRKLYNTYYFDRFYWTGQQLTKHVDRDACEISVTIHIGTDLMEPWPIWIKSPDGKEHSVTLSPGDGLVYKGCERPHWREPMPGNNKPGLENWYHQIFMHYVLQDGIRSHFAGDIGN